MKFNFFAIVLLANVLSSEKEGQCFFKLTPNPHVPAQWTGKLPSKPCNRKECTDPEVCVQWKALVDEKGDIQKTNDGADQYCCDKNEKYCTETGMHFYQEMELQVRNSRQTKVITFYGRRIELRYGTIGENLHYVTLGYDLEKPDTKEHKTSPVYYVNKDTRMECTVPFAYEFFNTHFNPLPFGFYPVKPEEGSVHAKMQQELGFEWRNGSQAQRCKHAWDCGETGFCGHAYNPMYDTTMQPNDGLDMSDNGKPMKFCYPSPVPHPYRVVRYGASWRPCNDNCNNYGEPNVVCIRIPGLENFRYVAEDGKPNGFHFADNSIGICAEIYFNDTDVTQRPPATKRPPEPVVYDDDNIKIRDYEDYKAEFDMLDEEDAEREMLAERKKRREAAKAARMAKAATQHESTFLIYLINILFVFLL